MAGTKRYTRSRDVQDAHLRQTEIIGSSWVVIAIHFTTWNASLSPQYEATTYLKESKEAADEQAKELSEAGWNVRVVPPVVGTGTRYLHPAHSWETK